MPFNDQLPVSNITALDFRDDLVWIGTPQGMGSYQITADLWSPISDLSYNVRDILCDENEALWLATSVGLVEYSLPDGRKELPPIASSP